MTFTDRRSGLSRSGLAGWTVPGLTSRRHVDYGRVRSAICPAR